MDYQSCICKKCGHVYLPSPTTRFCPFCQQELREIYCHNVAMGYLCPNPDCKKAEKLKGNAEFWQELIRTRKALDVAVDALKTAQQYICSDKKSYQIIQTAVEQITALTKGGSNE